MFLQLLCHGSRCGSGGRDDGNNVDVVVVAVVAVLRVAEVADMSERFGLVVDPDFGRQCRALHLAQLQEMFFDASVANVVYSGLGAAVGQPFQLDYSYSHAA